jgi:hypothetical protein
VSCLAESKVRDLNLFCCSKVSHISYCPNITDLTGLLSVTELVAVSPNSALNIRSGFETFSQINNLRMGLLGEDYQTKFVESLREAPLKKWEWYWNLSYWESFPAFIQLFNSLRHLQTLELHEFRSDLTIPAIPTLGSLKISYSFIPRLLIEGSKQNYPIYYVEILHCMIFTEFTVERPISFMKFCSFFCPLSLLFCNHLFSN